MYSGQLHAVLGPRSVIWAMEGPSDEQRLALVGSNGVERDAHEFGACRRVKPEWAGQRLLRGTWRSQGHSKSGNGSRQSHREPGVRGAAYRARATDVWAGKDDL